MFASKVLRIKAELADATLAAESGSEEGRAKAALLVDDLKSQLKMAEEALSGMQDVWHPIHCIFLGTPFLATVFMQHVFYWIAV